MPLSPRPLRRDTLLLAANLGTVGKQLLNLAPDFDPRTFGFRKLIDLVRKTNQFEIRQAEGGPVSIRVKQGGKK
ncbi:hypothetical protein EHS39_11740 [Ensifer sp. MPMI2T]|nr:hypothetical protein EHS39_11740 [Ensifer sp. MPMI2T]